MPTFYEDIEVTAEDPESSKNGGLGGGTGRLPGGGGMGEGGGGGGGSLPIWDWMKSGAEKAGGVMGPVGMGMDAFSMAAAPQQQAMQEAKAGSMAGHRRQQDIAWQSPEYAAWAQQLWGG